jgi:Ser/Thr protein kinase RdoA (MazF antagonist)
VTGLAVEVPEAIRPTPPCAAEACRVDLRSGDTPELWRTRETRYDELRDALLEAYAQIRPLPEDHAIHLSALFVLRRMQILVRVLESRDDAAFREQWQAWARDELDVIATIVGAERVAARAI